MTRTLAATLTAALLAITGIAATAPAAQAKDTSWGRVQLKDTSWG